MDNPAILEVSALGGAAVFPWADAIARWPGRRRRHLARVLGSLRGDLGGGLSVVRGEAPEVLTRVARDLGAPTVIATKEFTPSGVRTQDAVRTALATVGVELSLLDSAYVAPPGTIVRADGTGYQVFTPFSRAWRDRGWPPPYPPPDVSLRAGPVSDVNLHEEASRAHDEDPLSADPEVGEENALAALDSFLSHRLGDYPADRDRLDRDGTSGLSLALAFGEIHPRTIVHATAHIDSDAARAFERQIAWRDFHADVLWRHPEAMRECLRPVAPEGHWATGAEADERFGVWSRGETGFPIVDAGMRQLLATGDMHNRARMVAASFLVKDLHLEWQRGAEHFRRNLLDYDHAQNQLNWQWVAGTGRDAAPFFRVFNPQRQGERFDPDGYYAARWITELGSPEYPEPMVDHGVEREVSLAANRAVRRDR